MRRRSRARTIALEILYMADVRKEDGTKIAAEYLPGKLSRPELFEFTSRPVAVSLRDPVTRGMTVIDERFSGRNGPHQVQVAYSINPAAALELLLEALAAGPARP